MRKSGDIIKLIIALVAFSSFCQNLSSDYEKDLKLIFSTNKFGVNSEDVINVSIKNKSEKNYHHILYRRQDATYISFSAYMMIKSGAWIKLKEKYQSFFGPNTSLEIKPVKIKPGKSIDLFSIIIYPKRWFDIATKGKLKLIAHYNYKQLDTKATKDTLALKVPSFNLNSDTLIFEIK